MHTNGELYFLQSVLEQCEIVFDVGANIGNWMALALDINPRLQVHCFEPSVYTFQRLLERGKKAVFNNFGLSSERGKRTLWLFSEGAGINSLYKRHGLDDGYGLPEQIKEETISLDTLDDYCERVKVQSIDLLKVDVEGHELEVFKGAERMLAQGKIKRIQFEYGGCNIDSRVFLKDFFDLFEKNEYKLFKIFQKKMLYVSRYDQCLENFQYQNWLAISPEVDME